MTTYTAEQFRATLESYANLDWGDGSAGDRCVASLRIAVAVSTPGVIEQILSSYSGSVTHETDLGRAAALRTALLRRDG